MKTRTMDRSAISLTEIGFGAAGIGNLFRPISNVDAEDIVQKSWEQGIRYFDTAPHYGAGLSERRLGIALHSLPVSERILSTKVGRILEPINDDNTNDECGFIEASPFRRIYDYSYDGVMRSFEDSLQRLGVTKIDILFMHDLGRLVHGEQHDAMFKTAIDSGLKALSELRSQGLVKAIGLGVNEWQVCDQALAAGDFDCFMVANCFTLLNNDITETFTHKCNAKNVALIAAAPFNSGVLATGSSQAGHYFYDSVPDHIIEKVKKLEQVCEVFNVPLPAAAVQFPLKYSCVKSVVTGITKEARMKQTLAWSELKIPSEFWQTLVEQQLILPGFDS